MKKSTLIALGVVTLFTYMAYSGSKPARHSPFKGHSHLVASAIILNKTVRQSGRVGRTTRGGGSSYGK